MVATGLTGPQSARREVPTTNGVPLSERRAARPIAAERLEALPWATRCLACAAKS